MRVDEGPAVLPERSCGQIIKPNNDLSLPLSALHVSLSPNAGRRSAGDFPASPPFVTGRVLATSATLAFLCLCQVWFCFLAMGTASLCFFQGPPSAKLFASALADTVLLTAIFAVVWRLAAAQRGTRRCDLLTNVGFLMFLAIPANAVWNAFERATARLNSGSWRIPGLLVFSTELKVLFYVGAILLLAVVFYFHQHSVRFAGRMLFFLFPAVVFAMAEAPWILIHPHVTQPRAPNAPENPLAADRSRSAQRVVWILFDEMDYRLAFEGATNAHLPEFNRLAARSLHAGHAYPPGGRTMISIPALLSGRFVTNSKVVGASDLLLRYQGSSSPVRWRTDQTIFDIERQRGWRTAATGWYFPYQRIFGEDIDAWHDQGWRLGLNPNRPFAGLMADEFRILAESDSRSLLGLPHGALEHKRLVHEVVSESLRRAANPNFDLVFLHLPVPHFPFFYDARTGQDATEAYPVTGYLDHLQLGDRILGQIRRAIEEAGVADRTTLLISSDHWNRGADLLDGRIDHRIPFIVNFPGDSQGVRYNAPFNTLLSRSLVTAILEGKVRTAVEAAAWIQKHNGGLAESPYNTN
jgi:hypothetical protein